MTVMPRLMITLLTLGLALAACSPTGDQARSRSPEDIRAVNALLDSFGHQELARAPEMASNLGLTPEKAGYVFAGQLDNRSQAAFERTRLARLESFEALQNIDAAGLPAHTRASLEVTRAALTNVIEMSAFGHGQVSLGFSRPYAADQLSGAYIDLPDLLINRQIIRNRAEALTYIERLSKLADAINDDGRRLVADAHAGIVPPDFILASMIAQSQSLRPMPGSMHPIAAAFETLSLSADDLTPEERATLLLRVQNYLKDDIVPAYEAFEQILERLSNKARAAPGIWAIDNGSAYYEAALRFYTGQSVKPADLHTQGLEIVARLQIDLDIALQEAGFPDGSAQERLMAINALPEQVFANTPEGRQALLLSLTERMETIAPRLAELISPPPRASLKVAQIPDNLSAHAPGGYYAAAPADGTSPATFFINLRNTAEWPAYMLPTLFYHEAIPGHHLESAFLSEQGNMPIVRQLIWLPVYGEGWALYAEDLASELGVYDNDPFGKVGYIQSLLFRAARLVADTGLHHKRWSRAEAITYLVETTGQSQSAMATEVDRYTVWPGQAVSYMVGRQFIWDMRQRSQLALGDRFDLAAFHGIILANGPRPLDLVEADITAWIARQRLN